MVEMVQLTPTPPQSNDGFWTPENENDIGLHDTTKYIL